MVFGPTSDEISALRPDTDLSSVNFCIFLSHLGLHESTVWVELGSHMAERKRVRAHGVRDSVFYSNVECVL